MQPERRFVVKGEMGVRALRCGGALALMLASLMVAGCGANVGSSALPGANLRGSVRGGQQPVAGSRVYMFAAGTGGYTSAPTSLLTGSGVSMDANGNGYVTTDSAGSFVITGDYTCPSATSQIYLEAFGGNPGLPGNVNNPSLALLAVAGQCGALTPTTFLNLDEKTTALSAFELSGFANLASGSGSARDAFSTSASNAAGLTEGVSTVQVQLNGAHDGGLVLTAYAGTNPAIMNTVADVLANCVNSNGVTGECSRLIAAATPLGGTAPVDTIQAAVNLARNPTLSTSTLFATVPATVPFQPVYPTTPDCWLEWISTPGPFGDFSGSVRSYGGGDNPEDYALDAQGWVWTGVYKLSGTISTDGLVYYRTDPTASSFVPSGSDFGNEDPYAFAVDPSGVIWWLDMTQSFYSSGGFQPSKPIVMKSSPAGVMSPSSKPSQLAFDATGAVWLAEGTNFETGVPASSSSPPTAMLTGNGTTVAMSFDASGHLWTANKENTLSRYTVSGSAFTASALFNGGGLNGPGGIAIDHAGHVWVTNTTGNSLSEFDANGNALSPSGGFTGGGLNAPRGIAIDGDGYVWVSNQFGSTLSKFDGNGNPLSPSSGYLLDYDNGTTASFTGTPSINPGGYALCIDGAGTIWVGPNAIYGAAAPTVAPLALAVKNNTQGVRP
jgi:streptogramin lyase